MVAPSAGARSKASLVLTRLASCLCYTRPPACWGGYWTG